MLSSNREDKKSTTGSLSGCDQQVQHKQNSGHAQTEAMMHTDAEREGHKQTTLYLCVCMHQSMSKCMQGCMHAFVFMYECSAALV